MQIASTAQNLEFESCYERAKEFDIHLVIRRYMNKNKVTTERALAIAEETLRYLCLCATQKDHEWIITGEVDEMWHTFILFTEKYSQFCQQVFGYFLHHVPGEESMAKNQEKARANVTTESIQAASPDFEKIERGYSETLIRYKNIIGIDPDPTIWPNSSVFRNPTPVPCDGTGSCKPQPACGCSRPKTCTPPVPTCRLKVSSDNDEGGPQEPFPGGQN